uniref:Putative secreted protein n=1 Tax=Anopheles darlingi TaxID=43151 RepID=A0A2M4D6D8_ANODA
MCVCVCVRGWDYILFFFLFSFHQPSRSLLPSPRSVLFASVHFSLLHALKNQYSTPYLVSIRFCSGVPGGVFPRGG